VRPNFRAALSLLLALALLAPLPGLGQGQPPPGRPPAPPAQGQGPEEGSVFGETIEVRVVNLEAVVVDKQGNRVHGLKPQDFRLLIDGKPTSIDYFTEVADGRAVEEEVPAGAAPATPATPANIAGIEPGAEVGTSYVVFVDNVFVTLPRHRNLVLRGIIDQLEQMSPADRMAVVSFDGRRPELLSCKRWVMASPVYSMRTGR
jgi:hypothetical protein